MKRKYVILLHITFWLLLVLNATLPLFNNNPFAAFKYHKKDLSLFIDYFLIGLGFQSIAALCFYSNYLFVAPQLFVKKNYLVAVLYLLFIMGGMIGWRYIVEFGFFKPVLGFDNYKGNAITVSYYVKNIFFYYFPGYFIYGIGYFFVENWYINNRKKEELQKETLKSELAFLRSQINPHFLFNTINDIYSLTYQKSDEAPEALLKLSELLRYMLREGNDDFMPLSKEIQYLQNVIELQKIGAKGHAYISFEQEGVIGDQKVASLLFISFVENAFKHGVLKDSSNPVVIKLYADDGHVVFGISNKKNKDQKDTTGGIGLHNVKRRLELLYPGKHHLDITDGADFYSVDLSLQLNP